MSAISNIPVITNETSFIGLQSYSEGQANKFFGRDTETEQLTKLVEGNTLTIVFGKSGTGKTSLLNAGVFPRLRKNYCLPFRIRLTFEPDSPDLFEQIKSVLKNEIDKYGFNVESYPGKETLWEYFHTEPLWKSITPILVFDQFEEIFTLAQKNDRFRNNDFPVFWQELSDLIENSIPEKLRDLFLHRKEEISYNYQTKKVKVLFSFREEYLPEFESITTQIPSLKSSRFRLMQMNGIQAYEVVSKTWADKIDPSQAEKIVSYFSKEPGETHRSIFEIEPSLLSQVCTYIEKERIREGSNNISAELLSKYPKEIILRSIYEEAMAESNALFLDPSKKPGEKQATPMNTFVQEKLITDEGYRTRYTLAQADMLLMPGINLLEKKYFLRIDDGAAELTHDVLAPLIKTDRENRRKQMAATVANKKAWKRGVIGLLALLLIGIVTYIALTYQANKERNEANKEKREAIEKKEKVVKEIEAQTKNLKRIEVLIDSLKSNSQAITLKQLDSIYKRSDTLTRRIDTSQTPNTDIAELKIQLDKVEADYTASQGRNNILQKELVQLRQKSALEIADRDVKAQQLQLQLNGNTARLISSQQNFEKLKTEFDAYRLKYPITFPAEATPLNPETPNANSLLLSFGTSSKNKNASTENLTIYLIPVKDNKRILNDIKSYDIFCSGIDINKSSGIRKASNYGGQYFYNNVSEGEYLVKICSYYGGYKIIKRTKGKQTIVLPITSTAQ